MPEDLTEDLTRIDEALEALRSDVTRVNDEVAGVRENVSGVQGRVETVFVPLQSHVWGSFEPDTLTAIEHEQRRPGERDLLDVIAAFTLVHGGKVFAVDTATMPSSDPVAAVLRF